MGEIIHVIAWDEFEAKHKAARIDQFKFQPKEYQISIYNPKK